MFWAVLLSLPARAAAPIVMPLWPTSASAPGVREHDTTTVKDNLIAGKRVARLTNVTTPTIEVHKADRPGPAIVVFPGGGYRILAYDLEGSEVCDWLHSANITCVLVKYRVPGAGPYPEHNEDLADAQRAIRLTRAHAGEWGIDPKRVGALGFSAGAHLSVVLGNHPAESVYTSSDAADKLDARPDFVVLVYPGLLRDQADPSKLRSEVVPGPQTPPTFLVQAEDDGVHVENSTLYFNALTTAKVPAAMHIYTKGGHGYGLRKTELPVTRWPELVTAWLGTIGILH